MNKLLLLPLAAAVLGMTSCDKAQEATSKAKEAGAGAVDKAKDAAAGAVDKAKDAAAGAVDKAKEAGAGAVDAAKGAIDAAGGKLTEIAASLKGIDYTNPAGLGDLGTKLSSLNLDILPEGVKSAIAALKEPLAKVAEMVKSAPDGLKDSPAYQAIVEQIKPLIDKLKGALGGGAN
jgi:hypothetical protein